MHRRSPRASNTRRRWHAGLLCLLIGLCAGAAQVRASGQYESRVHSQGQGQGSASQPSGQRLRELRNNSYGKALTLRSLADKAARGKHYKQAIDYYRRALRLHSLSSYAQQQMRHNLAQLYLSAGKSRRATAMLERWLHSPNADADAGDYMVLGAAYAHSGHYRKAQAPIRKALSMRAHPPSDWYRLQLAVALKLGRYADATETLKTLAERSPHDKSLWLQLSTVRLKAGDDTGAVSAMEMADRQGLLNSPTERLRLARLYVQAGEPYQAARKVQAWIRQGVLPGTAGDWELLASAWLKARQPRRALAPLRHLARTTHKAQFYAELGQIHMDLQQWPEAAAALRAALHGGAAHPGRLYLALGLSYYHQSARDKARAAFKSAQRYGESRRQAGQWLAYLKQSA